MLKFLKVLFGFTPKSAEPAPVTVHKEPVKKPVARAKKVTKPAPPRVKKVAKAPVPSNVVPLVQPATTKTKKSTKPKKVVTQETISVVPPTKPRGRPKKDTTKK